MRRVTTALLAGGMLFASAVPALAHPSIPLQPQVPVDATHWATDNVEYLGRFAEHTGNAGGRMVGDRYYVTDPRGVYVYDVSNPAAPVLLGSEFVFQHRGSTTGGALAQEDPDTDGNILLVDGATTANGTGALQIVDVSDPDGAGVSVIATVATTTHTWSCVSAEVAGERVGCAYAYGRDGQIVDLRTPTNPALLPYTWRQVVGYTEYAHDLTEIRPGLAVAAGSDAVFIDTRDPAQPVLLGKIEQTSRWWKFGWHSIEWSQGGLSDFWVGGTEITPTGTTSEAGSDCNEGTNKGSVIDVWNAGDFGTIANRYLDGDPDVTPTMVRDAIATMTRADTYAADQRGIFLTGAAPGSVLFCAHWMELHPDFDNGGKVAVAYYNKGTRFLDVDEAGQMTEIGWIVGAEGYTGSPQWVSDEIVYIHDYTRGMEIVRLTDAAATGTYTGSSATLTPLAASSGGVPTSTTVPVTLGLLLLALDIHRRRAATHA